MPNKITPRPTIELLAVSAILPQVRLWLIDNDHVVAESVARSCLLLAFGFSADAYKAGRFLESQNGWPVNYGLIELLVSGLADARKGLTLAQKAWVIETGIRFQHAPRDPILFKDDDGVVCHGLVQTVREDLASAIVMLVDAHDQDDAGEASPTLFNVTAEDVIQPQRGEG